jgi:iron complex outermembrane receptor protein
MSNLLNLSRNRIIVPILGILLCWSLSAAAQNRAITGNITDANDGEPLIGATIVLPGSTNGGAVTDLDGNFKISVPQDAKKPYYKLCGICISACSHYRQQPCNKDA